MNSRDLKDLIYAYLSHNYDVYMDGDERAVIARHVCANEKCKSSWQKSIRECFYCGWLIPFVNVCLSCKSQFSLTNAKKSCPTCNSKEVGQLCMNDNCPLYNSEKLKKLFPKEKLAAESQKSSVSQHTIAHRTCLECGGSVSKFEFVSVTINKDYKADIFVKISGDNVVINGDKMNIDDIVKITAKINSYFK